MSKFKKKGKGRGGGGISTASLPDIIFILLFFFMVVTVMRETERKVEVKMPAASETTKRPLITTSLKVDKDTKMGIVSDIKQELRQARALKINYSTNTRSRDKFQ